MICTRAAGLHPLNVGQVQSKHPLVSSDPDMSQRKSVRPSMPSQLPVLAREGGYDGVEIMGPGYLINQFIATRTNHRKDD